MFSTLRRVNARQHHNSMEEIHDGSIAKCVTLTQQHDDGTFKRSPTPSFTPCVTSHIEVTNESLLDVMERVSGEGVRVCILNDGSYTSPCEGFAYGKEGWEAEICSHSVLGNVLGRMHEWYNHNRCSPHRGLYSNRALYTPNLPFFGLDGMKKVDVLTVSAPDKKECRACRVSTAEYEESTLARLDFALDAMLGNIPDVVVVGKWGSDPVLAAKCFNELLTDERYAKAFPHIVFAMPKTKDYKAFAAQLAFVPF